jgi:hypothetical protein
MTEEKKLNVNLVFLPVSSFFLATKLVLGERTSRRRSTGKGVVALGISGQASRWVRFGGGDAPICFDLS